MNSDEQPTNVSSSEQEQNNGFTPELKAHMARINATPQQFFIGKSLQQIQQHQPGYAIPSAANPGPVYAFPSAPVFTVAASSSADNGVSVSFPDGCKIGWNKVFNELSITGTAGFYRFTTMPARPVYSASGSGGIEEPEEKPELVSSFEAALLFMFLIWVYSSYLFTMFTTSLF